MTTARCIVAVYASKWKRLSKMVDSRCMSPLWMCRNLHAMFWVWCKSTSCAVADRCMKPRRAIVHRAACKRSSCKYRRNVRATTKVTASKRKKCAQTANAIQACSHQRACEPTLAVAPEEVGRAMAQAASSRRASAKHSARLEEFMTQKRGLVTRNKLQGCGDNQAQTEGRQLQTPLL